MIRTLRFIVDHPLNRGAKLAAVSRFARLQFAGRLIGKPLALPFVDATRLLVQRGMTGVSGNWYCGLHELPEMAFVLHALRAEDLFMDVGANAGSYSVLAAGAVGARAIAVEPLPETFARLTANLGINGLRDRVDATCCGLSAEAGELRFTTGLDTTNRVATPDETRATTRVPVTTLDALCDGRVPQIIKIDVEGHEAAVLDGAQRTLTAPGLLAVLMETNLSATAYGQDAADLFPRMAAAGFTACGYDPFARRLLDYRPGQENTVFARDPAALTERCRAAPRFALINGTI